MKQVVKAILKCDYNSIPFIQRINEKLNNSKIPFDNIKTVVEIVFLAACITEMIISLCNGQSATYQTFKDAHFARAMMYAALFVFVLQKVKLLNWQSIVAVILYIPVANSFRKIYIESPDLDIINLSVLKTYLILLLIVVDMIAFKRHAKADKYRWGIVIALFVSFVLVYRNVEILYHIAPFAVLYFVEMDEKRTEKMIVSICLGWIGAFFITFWESFTINPPNGERWYGKFLNIGDFGQFLGGAIIANLILIFYCYKKWKAKSIPFVLSFVPLPFILFSIFLSATRTELAGLFTAMLFLYIFWSKSKKKCFTKIGICALILFAVIAVGFIWMKWVLSWDEEMYYSVVEFVEERFPNNIAYHIKKTFEFYCVVNPELDPDKFDAPTILKVLNRISANRIKIWYRYWQLATFKGCGTGMVEVEEGYSITNAHNGYFQALYTYGYIPGTMFIVTPVICMINGGIQFLKTHMIKYLFPLLWCALILGIMIGEIEGEMYPLWATMLFALYVTVMKNSTNSSLTGKSKGI